MGKGDHYSTLLDWTKSAVSGKLTKLDATGLDMKGFDQNNIEYAIIIGRNKDFPGNNALFTN